MDDQDSPRLEALARANEVRAARAEVKERVAAGESPGPVILTPGGELASMPVLELLLAIPKVGAFRAGKLLGRAQVPEHKTLGAMTPHQRRRLVAVLASVEYARIPSG